tara:strand:+ start:215 stop:472 length:258 start_codon:yes stop_codon:yes gene_type:complete
MRNLREKNMDVNEKKVFIGKVISGEVDRLSEDDMVCLSELECDLGEGFDEDDVRELGNDELIEKVDEFGFDEVMLEYGVICLYDN